ncbi:peptidoglycan-binding domain-containing protein [Polaribacter uvawellassae]|uniref:peptidoglycan-binding domain-containing protein n=1 Tax=Polaribacter uvawellassae TaxID=3133495 RepID=UPI00321C282B
MKQIIILLLVIIALFIGFGKYNEYKRFNTSEVNYKSDVALDFNYHNKDLIYRYLNEIESLNSFVISQKNANDIDVRSPEEDDEETKFAVKEYSEKLAKVKYYEAFLEQSNSLKEKGLSNEEIIYLENTGTSLTNYKIQQSLNKIKSLFDATKKINYGQKGPLIFEVQKQLVANGIDVEIDGIYKIATKGGIKVFEERNGLYPDGILDILTIDALFTNNSN